MFTGIIETLGAVTEVLDQPPGRRLTIETDAALAEESKIGDIEAVNCCCHTVVALTEKTLAYEAGPETLSRTNLGELQAGDAVNLERSMRLGDLVGGHLVTGHVDEVGQLTARFDEGDWSTYWFSMPARLGRQMVSKGSIAVDGISLTLVAVEPEKFSVALIPHTLSVTTLGTLAVGGKVVAKSADEVVLEVENRHDVKTDEGYQPVVKEQSELRFRRLGKDV
ncbi:MAG: riboflavin synthase, partial [Planctomycetales bacterium]